MAKFNQKYGTTTPTNLNPIKSVGSKTAVNHGGATAYERDAKSDLFLLGVANFVGENTYYESAGDRDARFRQLVHTVTEQDPTWVEKFIPWLRNEANMRSAAVVAAVEYVKAGGPNARSVIASACSRADEPAEVLSYWMGRYGKPIPSSVKRGVSDAAKRLYNEYTVAKYDTNSQAMRFADVIQLAHTKPKDASQSALFKYTLDSRYGATPTLDGLPMLQVRKQVDRGEITRDQLLSDPALMKSAGMTWESLSGLGQMDAAAWEAVIPQMGYMALLRNLRNFDQAGISAKSRAYVISYLSDPEKVAKSRQLPFRFWSAHKNTSSLHYAGAIETALELSLQNLPAWSGRTLIVADTSASMECALSGKGTMSCVDAASLFAVALALKGENVDLYGFADYTFEHKIQKGASVLRTMEAFTRRIGEAGHGTNIPSALGQWNGHDRVVIFSDMQTLGRYDRGALRNTDRYGSVWGRSRTAPQATMRSTSIPANVPIFGFNLGGYATTQIGDTNEYELGGLTDHTFKLIPLLERRQRGQWPWEA